MPRLGGTLSGGTNGRCPASRQTVAPAAPVSRTVLCSGLSDFNARARASNFDPEELPAVMQYLHDRGVKGYVVLNVLGE